IVDCLYSTGVNQQQRHQATPDPGPGFLRIGELAKRTGVSPELLRAWEQRYRLLQPTRTPGGFRLYSTPDEARVQRMQSLVAGGRAAPRRAAVCRAGGGAPTRAPRGGRPPPWGRRPPTSARHWTGWTSRPPTPPLTGSSPPTQIGRASCRERVEN